MQRDFLVGPRAEDDYDDIEWYTRNNLGNTQAEKYLALILTAFDVIANDPFHVLSKSRTEVSADLRSFHIRHAKKQARASHVIYYFASDTLVFVSRILHQRANVPDHIDDLNDL